ncbi:response regulator [Agreia pratensis]|uniref:Two-component system, OmpR family, KDP operon response regulator KdpE n=1 Tax=Agreia pratensis TaxID=150121 RepID=A0A1X7L4L6_9MICO|nr:response regulator [Agreia pratensis]MBF4636183.1 response regulator [Agreia pratensis]SMG48192.1 two-component system, OmpR family, KDP operon response regulator KdpE [Agreia pratensis]
MKILIADDDPQILRALSVTLRARGYDVATARDGAEALNAAIDQHPDLVMLDLGMPKLNGIEVIEGLRGWSQVPILVVSGRTDGAEKVLALDAGADDYVTKPFAIDELLARIRALTRRVPTAGDEALVAFGDVTIDLSARQVTRRTDAGGDETVRLTPTEWIILETLVRSPGRLVTRAALLTAVWGPNHTNDSGYLRVYLAQLRKKLEQEPARPRHLLTEAGMGYRFVQ